MSDHDRISPYIINTISSIQVIRIKRLGDYKLIQSQILQTNIARTVWQTVGRINEILGVKGLKMQLVKEILIAFVGSSAQASGIITLRHFRVLVVQ